MKGLVVAGAGLHGPFQLGVLETLIKRDGYKPDFMVGCSVGATTVAALSHLGFNAEGIDRLKEVWFGLKNIRSIFGRNWTFPVWSNGYYNGDPLRKLLGKTIEGLAPTIPFEVAVHDLLYGQTVYFGPTSRNGCLVSSCGPDMPQLDLLDAVEASYSIPLVIDAMQDRFVDGGVIDCAPVERAVALGATEVDLVLGYDLQVVKWGTKSRSAIAVAERVVDVCTSQLLIDDVQKVLSNPNVKTRVFKPAGIVPIGMLEVDPEKIKAVWELGKKSV